MRVLLLHGLWMPGLSMRPLALRLRAAGFHTSVFAYHGALRGAEHALSALLPRLRQADAVVAHSLGGLMALEALRRGPEVPVRRVLCLGSPLCGSATARAVRARGALGWALGRSAAMLCAGCGDGANGRVDVAAIAGDVPFGLGGWLAHLEGEHDGAVAVAETRLPGLADHRVVHASHSGLLLSPTVAALAADFLREGRFRPPPGGQGASV